MSIPSNTDCESGSEAGRAHVRSSFEFTVRAPCEVAAPLFGAEGERSWAGKDWDPQFIYPRPARDVEGAVFTIKHGAHQALWVNTAFDIAGRHIHYVYFITDTMVTTVDLTFAPVDSASTKVNVVYERTALSQTADDEVLRLGSVDRGRGADWEKAINVSLGRDE